MPPEEPKMDLPVDTPPDPTVEKEDDDTNPYEATNQSEGDDQPDNQKTETEPKQKTTGTDKGEKPKSTSETSDDEKSKEAEQARKEVLDGWREDREAKIKLEDENLKLKERLAKHDKEEDEGWEDLSEEEKVDKILARKEKAKEETAKREEEKMRSEIRYYHAHDSVFRKNMKEILKTCDDYKVDIKAGIAIFKDKLATVQKIKKGADYQKKRKKQAAGAGGSSAGGGKPSQEYDPKKDKDKSASELYSEGGIN